jgi:hypothetical protein
VAGFVCGENSVVNMVYIYIRLREEKRGFGRLTYCNKQLQILAFDKSRRIIPRDGGTFIWFRFT